MAAAILLESLSKYDQLQAGIPLTALREGLEDRRDDSGRARITRARIRRRPAARDRARLVGSR